MHKDKIMMIAMGKDEIMQNLLRRFSVSVPELTRTMEKNH
jgi:hypothetical protein